MGLCYPLYMLQAINGFNVSLDQVSYIAHCVC